MRSLATGTLGSSVKQIRTKEKVRRKFVFSYERKHLRLFICQEIWRDDLEMTSSASLILVPDRDLEIQLERRRNGLTGTLVV